MQGHYYEPTICRNKVGKNQILIFNKSGQIVPQNEALVVNVLKNLHSRSSNVTQA